MTRRALVCSILSLGLLLGVGLGVRDASADLSAKVIKAFAGQVVVSDGPLEPADNDKDTIAAFKKQRLEEVKGEPNREDVVGWSFHYTAFLKQKGATNVQFEFHRDGKFVADRRLDGVDSSLTVLQGTIQITEDDGPAKGHKYTLKLTGKVKGKEVTLASTPLTLK